MSIRRIALLAVPGLMALAAAGPAHAADPGWQRKVSALIGANYAYPRSAVLRGEQGSAKVKIAFSGAGKVLSVDLVKSTGSAILDREAVRIPRKVGAYPAPPTGSNTDIIVPITWRIDED
jgi:protein TonB